MNDSKLEIIIGPMFSGKSSTLIRTLNVYHQVGLRVLYINHIIDTRSKNHFSTHDTTIQTIQNFDTLKTDSLNKFGEEISSYEVVGIDESQFFDDLEVCKEWVDHGTSVIVCGLCGDFKRKKFGKILDLIPHSDSVIKLNAWCQKCTRKGKLKEAIFTQRVNEQQSQTIVGGKDKYLPVCRNCYHRD